jgi:single-stranded DNA-binding protein
VSALDVAFFGVIAADAERKVAQSGKPWVRLRVGAGQGDQLQWVSVAVFGKAADAAGELKKGDRAYFEGSIKLDTWTGRDGVERHGLSVAAFVCARTHNIGRRREKRSGNGAPTSRPPAAPGGADPSLNDEIPW